jgi:hypothetical protein
VPALFVKSIMQLATWGKVKGQRRFGRGPGCPLSSNARCGFDCGLDVVAWSRKVVIHKRDLALDSVRPAR